MLYIIDWMCMYAYIQVYISHPFRRITHWRHYRHRFFALILIELTAIAMHAWTKIQCPMTHQNKRERRDGEKECDRKKYRFNYAHARECVVGSDYWQFVCFSICLKTPSIAKWHIGTLLHRQNIVWYNYDHIMPMTVMAIASTRTSTGTWDNETNENDYYCYVDFIYLYFVVWNW